jgi:hypothetical protein
MAASAALALAAAILSALGTVLQQRVAATATGTQAMRAGFLLRLARQPLWLVGIAVDVAGFVCQAAALGLGRIVVVQPLLASSVVFALPFGSRPVALPSSAALAPGERPIAARTSAAHATPMSTPETIQATAVASSRPPMAWSCWRRRRQRAERLPRPPAWRGDRFPT